jgi:ferredoxin
METLLCLEHVVTLQLDGEKCIGCGMCLEACPRRVLLWATDEEHPMQMLIKVVISVSVIVLATALARRFPLLAGLIGVMPLTGALVLGWVYLEYGGDPQIMQSFAKGAFWGILPTLLFFFVAFLCLKKGCSLPEVLAAGFAAWTAAAFLHQWLLK